VARGLTLIGESGNSLPLAGTVRRVNRTERAFYLRKELELVVIAVLTMQYGLGFAMQCCKIAISALAELELP
jgi:hypothetical protein